MGSLVGVIMGTRFSEDFMAGGGRDVVSKAELFGMLIEVGLECGAT